MVLASDAVTERDSITQVNPWLADLFYRYRPIYFIPQNISIHNTTVVRVAALLQQYAPVRARTPPAGENCCLWLPVTALQPLPRP